MSRTLIVQHWTFHTAFVRAPKRQDYPPANLNGPDLLGFIQSITTPSRAIDNEPRQRWTRVDGINSTRTGSRSLLIKASSGRYGEAGDVVDRLNGKVAFTLGADHAPTAPTRSLVIIPDSGMHAVAFYERSSTAGASGIELFNGLWKRQYLESGTRITWHADWIDEPAAWLEEASLKAVEVRRYNGSSQTAGPDSTEPAEFIYAARAGRSRFLGRGTLDAVLEDARAANLLVGVEYVQGDRVFVEVKVGDRQAKYQIGEDDLPKLQQTLKDHLSDQDFIGECIEQARDRVLPELGIAWNPSWV